MRSTYFISITCSVVLAITGCQKLDEDPKASLTPVTYFKTQSDLDAALAGVYEQYSFDGAYGFTSRMTSYFGSDDLTTDPGLNKADMRDFDRLNGGSANNNMVAQWQGPWKAIYQANNVLANYEKVSTGDEQKRQAAGQALFLRAWGYYNLVRTFGPVPLITTPISADARPPRDSVSKIYASIISDLQTAKSWLPESFSGQPGKANQFAARAMLADVYLTMTGWPLNQSNYYASAAAEADTVIRSGKFNLSTPYAQVFTTNNTPESIFALQFNVSGGLPQRSFGSSSVPLDEIALDGSGGWDDYYPEINFYLNAPKCSRTDATFYTTIKLLQSDNTYKLVPWNSSETHAGHPYFKKFRSGLNGDGVKETETTIQSINPSTNKALDIIRYPQVLLDYAEAVAMSGNGPTGDAYAAINQVRQRAGLPALTGGLDKTAFRDSVVYERAYEFAGEFGIRWFDIVRLQLLPQVIAARSPLENQIPGTTSGSPTVLQQKYLSPIPFNEMLRNPQWAQNTGY
ncbi:RagB/SusD family nutrient uptake outer membrane protein [Deminuibacter soli]|uniref:RagB/SusD family nutrient uptake outer membrane protein n=1 Tax=Deminuibacter soli TaxID=2291815 RepID=A0A3E1NL34_9BACT|nr:RagB/SusD family nutrient uptake outer membrane protein [Deminuibacter soli]RFM28498.1 RagB/SusD family nutrient uptake outer membrane protein [Deminuibacter soli]